MAWSIFTDGGGQRVAVAWARQLLAMIGAPRTPGNVQFVYDWEVSEGGGGRYNPLNQGPVPGQPNLTTTGQQYGGGAADFASWQAGLTGAKDYLDMPAYQGIRDSLRNDDPAGARAALIMSPWAASHYNDGRNFSDAAVPGGKSAIPAGGFGAAGNSGGGGGGGGPGPDCLVSFPGVKTFGFFGPTIGGGCALTKGEARAFIGATLVTAGAGLFLVATLILAAYGLKSTGAQKQAADVVGAVPLPQAQAAAAAIRGKNTGGRKKAPAPAPAPPAATAPQTSPTGTKPPPAPKKPSRPPVAPGMGPSRGGTPPQPAPRKKGP